MAAILVGAAAFGAGPVSAEPGSVYTTDRSGTNNQNTRYASKDQVFLTVGACKGGSNLADGSYFFEVTDPSTKAVLSERPLADRWFTVTGGLVRAAGPGHALVPSSCLTANDDHLVGLMPFANTTSPGGEYKLTIAHVADCPATAADASLAACGHAIKKTDTFKVNFDVAVATQVSATRIAVGTNTTVTDAVTVTGTAAEGYPHGTVTVYFCTGGTCSATAAGARVIGSFDTAKGKETKGVLAATGSVGLNVKDLAVGTYTFNAVYEPANHVAYNAAADPGDRETFEIYGGGSGGGGGDGATPGGSVAGVTSPPKATLPPTDLTAQPARPGEGTVLFLLGLLGCLTLAGTLVPARKRGRRK